MFKMGDNLGDLHAVSYKLDVRLPIDLYVIDLGGGIKPPSKGRNIGLAQVISGPLRAILTGMMDSRIRNAGPKPMDMSGLVGIMMRHAISNPEQERGFSEPCYVLVSDRYLNYTSRVGYHFSVLDSYCGETPNKNYISFLFQGGASDLVRRNRRVRALAGILSHFGFSIELESDKITARISKISRSEIQAHLEMFGRLLQFFRQLDVAMTSEAIVTQMQEAFISGNYQYRAEQSSP
jgi:pyruvate,water dikinase